MPSTRKQKAKEKRSRQSDVMSDLENVDIMLGGPLDRTIAQESILARKTNKTTSKQIQNSAVIEL